MSAPAHSIIRGSLLKAERGRNNYRTYHQSAPGRAVFISNAQRIDLRLEVGSQLLSLFDIHYRYPLELLSRALHEQVFEVGRELFVQRRDFLKNAVKQPGFMAFVALSFRIAELYRRSCTVRYTKEISPFIHLYSFGYAFYLSVHLFPERPPSSPQASCLSSPGVHLNIPSLSTLFSPDVHLWLWR